MHKASLRMSIGLVFLLTTVTIVQAADSGTEDPNNWPQYNRTANAWRYSPLDQINKDNIGNFRWLGSPKGAISQWGSKKLQS